MKKSITYFIGVFFFIHSTGLSLQLFGNKKSKSSRYSRSSDIVVASNNNQDEPFIQESVPTVTSRKNIESVIPVKRIPQGWIFRGELLAPWESNLPAVLSVIPDTTLEVIYQDDSRTTKDGIVSFLEANK